MKRDLLNKKCKKTRKYLNYVEHLLMLALTVTGCLSNPVFPSMVFVSLDIKRLAIGLKICAITAEIKNFKSIIKNKKKKHNKIALLGKSRLDTIEVLICKALIDSYISHEEFVSVNNVLKK